MLCYTTQCNAVQRHTTLKRSNTRSNNRTEHTSSSSSSSSSSYYYTHCRVPGFPSTYARTRTLPLGTTLRSNHQSIPLITHRSKKYNFELTKLIAAIYATRTATYYYFL
mmetsp:Transcript_21471/g.59673  ORF Transcript_21471/g.59673 Transcript_21471/m.59673 type:complete len:109 (-) Transcript_21471:1070-1396(-)